MYRATLGSDGKAVGTPQVVPDKYLNSNWGASLSSDGKQIAYYSARPGPVLVVRNLTSGEERAYPLELEINTGYFNGPAWLVESRSVLVSGRTNQSRNMSWHRVDLASGRVRRHRSTSKRGRGKKHARWEVSLRPGGGEFQSACANQPGNLGNDCATGGVACRKCLRQPRDIPRWETGRLCSSWRCRTKPLQAEILIIYYASGGQPRPVFRYPSDPALNLVNILVWSADRRHILFAREGEIWRVPWTAAERENGHLA